MSEKQVREHDKFMLRLPDGMRERLKQLAAENKRSLNAEIIARLEDTLAFELGGPNTQDADREARREKLHDLQFAYRLRVMERAIRAIAEKDGIALDIPEWKP